MRIRKNAKNLQLSGTNSTFSVNPVPQATICQLNQSRWDVKVDDDLNVFGNDDAINPIGVVKNAAPSDISKKGKRHAPNLTEVTKSTAPLNEVENGEQTAENPAAGAKRGAAPLKAGSQKRKRSPRAKEKNDELVLCPEVDKNGWQCGRPVEHGSTMCKDHLEYMSFFSSSSSSSTSTPNSEMTPNVLYYGGYNGPTTTARRRAMEEKASGSKMTSNDPS